MGNQKLKWTEEEEEALLAGVEKHGPGKWKHILRDPQFAHPLSNRSNIDLKDKWRNLSVPPDIQGSNDKVRTPKIKAAALNLAAAASPTSIPSPVAPPLPRTGSSDLNLDDCWNTMMVDAKNAPRYDGMIFEALSALTDPNGSDVTASFNFIEQKRHQMPATFKRVLGSRLRRLAAQGKIEKVNQLKAGVSLLLNKSAKLLLFFPICLEQELFWYVLVPMQHQTQNFYNMNGNSFSGMRTPVVARPKEANVKPRQTNSKKVPTVSQGRVNHASGTAAFKLVEVEKKLEMVKVAAAEIDKMIQLTEKAETILLLAEELHEACSQGKIVELN